MRAPDDLPRRQRQPGSGRRRRAFLIVAVIVLLVLLTSLRGIAGFYTDYLWFDSLEQGGVWRGRSSGARMAREPTYLSLIHI